MSLEELGIMLLIPLGLVIAYLLIRTAVHRGTREALREHEQQRAAGAATRDLSSPE